MNLIYILKTLVIPLSSYSSSLIKCHIAVCPSAFFLEPLVKMKLRLLIHEALINVSPESSLCTEKDGAVFFKETLAKKTLPGTFFLFFAAR